ncbi:MAG: TIGR00701 family protein [Marinosulfonomonas sp.]|nr:MAG: TIGR00701 family protein [Marinosulfonomonas sp.]
MWDMIINLLSNYYLWVKALHIISVIAWMAGIFYLPRLFVYHTESVQSGSETDLLFQTMERKLLYLIMRPSMYSTWIFGLLLVTIPGVVDWSFVWPWIKVISIVIMTWFHFWLAARRLEFAVGKNTRSGKQYRMMNEVPTVLMFVIVFSVVLKF